MTSPGKARVRSLDVRDLIARGEEPFPVIMAAVAALQPNESFVLTTPFLPSPLIERLHADGFAALPERQRDGGWVTRFSRG